MRQNQNRLAKLARAIGGACARREVQWMKRMQPDKLQFLLDRRLRDEPLQYILGSTPFGPLDLVTRPPTLIPRPETEDWAIRLTRLRSPSPAHPVRVLDLCTGSGCIPLLLCHTWPPGSTRAVGVDISPDAIRLAAENTSQPSPNVFTPLLADLRDPDLLDKLDPPPPFDVITSNPPYIPLHDWHTLPRSVKHYEDPCALIGDLPGTPHRDGLAFYRIITALLARPGLMRPDAIVALEVGDGQAHAVAQILRSTPGLPCRQIDIWKDPWDKARVVFARMAGSCSGPMSIT